MLYAEMIAVGDELLRGSTLNTNARFIGRELQGEGFIWKCHVACPDQKSEIKAKLGEALSRSDLVILSGGLGPTPDDVTRDAIAEYFSLPLKFSSSQYKLIRQYYAKRKAAVPSIVRREAMFPEGSVPLVNRYGIALGFSIVDQGRLVIALPGVPKEFEKMYINDVRPLIHDFFKHRPQRYALIVKTVGVSEPTIMTRLKKDFFNDPHDFGIYPMEGEVALRLYASDPKIIQRLRRKAKARLKQDVYAWAEESLAEVIQKKMIRKKKTLAIAESCTGGLVGAEITKVAGASAYFRGAVVAYHNQVKEKLLRVPHRTLQTFGAVSAQTAKSMSEGVRRLMGTDLGLSITGVAGPSGGSSKKPVGKVFFALSDSRGTRVWEHAFWGDRSQIQSRAVKRALELVWRRLEK